MKDTFDNIEWLHELLEFNSTGLWRIVINNNTGVNEMYASQSMMKLLGLHEHPSPEKCYEHWFSRVGKEYVDYVLSGVGEMLATKEQVEVSYHWNHPEDGYIFVRCSGKVEREENNVYELRGYHQNITEMESHRVKETMSVEELKLAGKINSLKKRSKRLGEQSQAWKTVLRTLLRPSNTFEIYYYPQKRLIRFPESVAELYKWELEYTNMPKSFSHTYVDVECREVFEEMFENIHKGIETTGSEASLFGGKKWFRTNLSILEHGEDGEPLLAIGIVQDITENKINQLENLQLQSIYKFTVNNDYECLLIIDLESNSYSVRYTENWQIFGSVEDDNLKDNFKSMLSKIIQPNDLEKFDLNYIIKRLNRKEEKTHIIWYTALNKEHKEACCYWLEENKKLLITIRNIEKRWKQEAENKRRILDALEVAEAANQAKSDFLSRISHDIRTPLNAVVGMTAIAKKYRDNPSKVEECLDSINSSSRYLTLLINDVLDMAKIESQKLKLSKENFILDEFLDKMLDIVRPLMDTRKHNFTVIHEGVEHQRVRGDSVRLQQLLLNILSNAVKYTNPGGKIDFIIKELPCDRAGWCCYQFDVNDNGIGMDREFLTRLFNPFERKDSARVSHIEGTGLGMSIAKNIANLMDGDITVESEPDKGSKFSITVYLELQGDDDYSSDLEQGEKQIPNYSGRNILLVEDNAVNTEIAAEILSSTGCNIETAENGQEAVEKAEQSPENYYSMIFMDVRMPIMNGYEAVKLIRSSGRKDMKEVPIIAMTADAFAEDVKKAMDCGMNAHISKPIDIDRLYDIMRGFEKIWGGAETK